MLKYVIGIDGGGSKTHALLMDSHQNIIDEALSGAANIKTDVQLAYNSVNHCLNELITRNNLNSADIYIVLGVAGYSSEKNRQQFLDLLNPYYPHLKLTSDTHIACLAAHNGDDGAIIICGTGISAYYMQNGTSKQIGGWGFPHGDLGGAAWIGLEVCRSTCKAIDHIIEFSPLLTRVFSRFDSDIDIYKAWLLNASPKDFADVAKLMLESNISDPMAKQIFDNALNEVREFIIAVNNLVPTLPMKITGGLATTYHPILSNSFPDLEIMDMAPAYGACVLGFMELQK